MMVLLSMSIVHHNTIKDLSFGSEYVVPRTATYIIEALH